MTTINGGAPKTNPTRATEPKANEQDAPKTPPAAGGATDPGDTLEAAPKRSLFGGFNFGDIKKNLGSAVEDIQGKMMPKITDQEREALTAVHGMLTPDKLAGADGKFNYGDRRAIYESIMRDKPGMTREIKNGISQDFAQKRAQDMAQGRRGLLGRRRPRRRPKLGHGRMAENAAKKAADAAINDGRWVPGKRIAQGQIEAQAPKMLYGGLNEALIKAKINPETANNPDNAYRNLSIGELTGFEKHGKVMDQLQERMIEKYGFEVVFPEGITQEGIKHVLDGKFGLPPGGVIKKAVK